MCKWIQYHRPWKCRYCSLTIARNFDKNGCRKLTYVNKMKLFRLIYQANRNVIFKISWAVEVNGLKYLGSNLILSQTKDEIPAQLAVIAIHQTPLYNHSGISPEIKAWLTITDNSTIWLRSLKSQNGRKIIYFWPLLPKVHLITSGNSLAMFFSSLTTGIYAHFANHMAQKAGMANQDANLCDQMRT